MDINVLLRQEHILKKRFTTKARNAIMLVMFACAFMLLLEFLTQIAFYTPLTSDDEITSTIFVIIVYCIYMSVPFLLVSVCFKRLFKTGNYHLRKRSIKKPHLFVLGTLGIGYLTNLTVNLLFPNFVEHHSTEVSTAPQTTIGIILLYISNAVLPAILEEWAFRGVICKNLLPYNKYGAIILSALLFGLMHINPTTVIFTTVIGILLAICYEKTGSLKLPMLIHLINNAFATTVTLFSDAKNAELFALITFFVMVSLMIMGIVAIVYYTKNGISKKPFSIFKPNQIQFRLTEFKFFICTAINIGIIPLTMLYKFFYDLIYSTT